MFETWDSCIDPTTKIATLRCIPIVFKNVISAALLFVGIVAIAFIIYAGIGFTMSGGDPKKVDGARRTMTFAILGLTIVLLSFGIIIFIGYITGSADCITSFADAGRFLSGCE